jgi:hypothetical protein
MLWRMTNGIGPTTRRQPDSMPRKDLSAAFFLAHGSKLLVVAALDFLLRFK